MCPQEANDFQARKLAALALYEPAVPLPAYAKEQFKVPLRSKTKFYPGPTTAFNGSWSQSLQADSPGDGGPPTGHLRMPLHRPMEEVHMASMWKVV